MMLLLLMAQAAAVPVAPAATEQGVISYPPAFFAAQQPSNALDMLNRIPGFNLDTGDSVRGYEGAAGNVLIDGQRPASKTDALDEILKRLQAGQVERIDLIRGGAPGIDMQGKSVLANVIRKAGGGQRLLVAVANNHAPDGRNGLAARLEGSGGLGGARKWEFGSYIGKQIDDGSGPGRGQRIYADGRPPVTSHIDSEGDGFNAFATGAVDTPLLGGKLRLKGRLARNKFKYDEDNILLTPVPGLETADDVDVTEDTEIGGSFDRDLNARTKLELVALRQTHGRDLTSIFATSGEVDDFRLDRDSTETIGRAVLKYRFSERLSLEAGGEAALNKLDSKTRFSINGAAIALPAADVQVEEKRSELFAKGAWRPTSQWTLDGGVRYESSTISSEGDVVLGKTLHFVKPRLAASWQPVAATQLRLRLEREVGQLNFNDFVASANLNTGTGITAGNPDLNPEQAWVAEAAIEQRFWGSGVIVLTARHYELKDAVDRGPVFTATGVFDRPTNIGDGTKDELAVQLTIPFERFGLVGAQLKGDVTRRWSKVIDPTTRAKREISGLRPIEWNASFSYDMPQHHLTWGADAFGAWRERYYRFNQIETSKLKTYVKPFAEWRPRPDLNLRVELPNITSRGFHRTVLTYPGPRGQGARPDVEDRDVQFGRMFYFRVRKTFAG
jgi:outer membrane receptor protein involved in Fe transport